jgi:hypothetical protein
MSAATVSAARESIPPVEIDVNYLRPMKERPWTDVVDLNKRNFDVTPRHVRVENGWRIANDLALDKQGFIALKHQTAVTDFTDANQLRTVYAREMETLVKNLTGADRTLSIEVPLTRFSGKAGSIQPGYTVHLDFTFEKLGERMHERGIDLKSPEFSQYSRVCIYQTWRALSGPGQDSTLALADARSVKLEDCVAADMVRYQENFKPGFNEFFLINASDAHRWYYFPKLERDDLLVWTGIDLTNNRILPAHTAFKDPNETAAPPRASVETRVYTFFK